MREAHAVRQLARRSLDLGGGRVDVSTIAAAFGVAGLALRGASEAAVELMTKAWAAEYGPRGVRVNAVRAGAVRTEGTSGMGEYLDVLAAQAPAGRPAEPEEIPEAIAYTASDAASFVQGVLLPVHGSRTAVC
ncbi:SDR family NAD(P)-dependent oxidoreductase [Streptomyces shenzhenensis]|uniref:Short-chain dehydrogenase n=1 Tax=Streptomyces shenzhenensis TaxID=943815 RepID=A0A3M0I7L5_9ACTN|nr:SDR family oxidoreductase [Streptomyces shenzhenensis]RMB84774.1 hypothetical protein CTZ28_16605 [Streptomyces shenzhenensis]